jgi:hypothetical protein
MQYLMELETIINVALHEAISRAVTENEPEQEALG